MNRSEKRLAARLADPSGPAPVVDAGEALEDALRRSARGLMAEHGVSQAQLAGELGVSQSSVHHMLTNRQHGLSLYEVSVIETLCGVPAGRLYHRINYLELPTLGGLIFAVPGMDTQTADALLGIIQTVYMLHLRATGGRHDKHDYWSTGLRVPEDPPRPE